MSERKALRLVRAAMCTGCVSVMVVGGTVLGQVVQPVRPQVGTWSVAEAGEDWPSPQSIGALAVNPIVRVKIVHAPQGSVDPRIVSAQLTAAAVKQEMVALLGATGIRRLDPNHVDVLLQNFGDWKYGGETRFFHPDDAVTSLPRDAQGIIEWPVPATVADTEFLQPWMLHGKEGPREWMIAFVAELRALCQTGAFPNVFPHRFEFDTEFALTAPGEPNLVFLLKHMVADPLWEDFPVPGHSGASMMDLWAGARAQNAGAFELSKEQIYPGANHPNPWSPSRGPENIKWFDPEIESDLKGFEFKSNRDIYLWYSAICQRVVDWLMDNAAYQPLQGLVPAG